MSEQEPIDEQQVADALAAELSQLRVENVLVGALIQVSSIGYRKLGLSEDTKEAIGGTINEIITEGGISELGHHPFGIGM